MKTCQKCAYSYLSRTLNGELLKAAVSDLDTVEWLSKSSRRKKIESSWLGYFPILSKTTGWILLAMSSICKNQLSYKHQCLYQRCNCSRSPCFWNSIDTHISLTRFSQVCVWGASSKVAFHQQPVTNCMFTDYSPSFLWDVFHYFNTSVQCAVSTVELVTRHTPSAPVCSSEWRPHSSTNGSFLFITALQPRSRRADKAEWERMLSKYFHSALVRQLK